MRINFAAIALFGALGSAVSADKAFGKKVTTCKLPENKDNVFKCDAERGKNAGKLDLMIDTSKVGGPTGEAPLHGFLKIQNIKQGGSCTMKVNTPNKIEAGVNVRFRALCIDSFDSTDNVTFIGADGEYGVVSGAISKETDWGSFGTDVTIYYTPGQQCERNKNGKCKKKTDRKLAQSSDPVDVAQWVLEYDTVPGCPVKESTPDNPIKVFTCDGLGLDILGTDTQTVEITPAVDSTGYIVASGGMAEKCKFDFKNMLKGYTIDFEVECMAAGLGSVTFDGDRTPGSLDNYNDFLKCVDDGCAYNDVGTNPTVNFKASDSVFWDRFQNDPLYATYRFSSVTIKYTVKAIPGVQQEDPPKPVSVKIPSDKNAKIFYCTPDGLPPKGEGKDENGDYVFDPEAKISYGNWFYQQLGEGDYGYIYHPKYENWTWCGGFFMASNKYFDGTFDLELAAMDTEYRADWLYVGTDSWWRAFTGRSDDMTDKQKKHPDTGNYLYYYWWSDWANGGNGWLLKYEVKQGTRCPWPTWWWWDYSDWKEQYKYWTNSYYCYNYWWWWGYDRQDNTTDVSVKADQWSRGALIVDSYSPQTCNFNVDKLPTNYEMRVQYDCIAKDSTNKITLKNSKGDVVAKYDENDDIFEGIRWGTCSDKKQCEYNYTGLDQGSVISIESDRGIYYWGYNCWSWYYYWDDSTYEYCYEGWYYPNRYEYWTPRTLLSYSTYAVDKDAPIEKSQKCSADINELKDKNKGIELKIEESNDWWWSNWMWMSIPVTVDSPFTPETSNASYIYLDGYKNWQYYTVNLYLVSSNGWDSVSSDITIDLELICLDTEPDKDYLYVGGEWRYDSATGYQTATYFTVSGGITDLAYPDMGRNIWFSFWSDQSFADFSGFVLKYKVNNRPKAVDEAGNARSLKEIATDRKSLSRGGGLRRRGGKKIPSQSGNL